MYTTQAYKISEMLLKCFALSMLVMCKTDYVMHYCVANHFCVLVSTIASV